MTVRTRCRLALRAVSAVAARTAPLIGLVLLSGPAAWAQLPAQRGNEPANNPCGKIYQERYGPYDYRTERDKLKIVEEYHFSPGVEFLVKGLSGHFSHDLNYTLMSSPNHPRALLSAVRYGERTQSDQPFGLLYTVECYFDRAVRYRPDDTVVRALYAQYLHKRKRTADGLRQLDTAVGFAGDSAFSHYNLGLMYLELGEPDKALAQAHRAIELGVTRDELMNELKKQGKWRDPETK